ncbi:MAG TPA: AAA family ATPase [Thermoanaerobaculia bacterium]|nr:AAA family ATPase [Thermoanaerobaculia bacterium]
MESALTIIGLQAENVRGIKAVCVTPKTHGVVSVKGKNGSGKSSLLDSIERVLNPKAAHGNTLRNGESSARVIADIGPFIVKRTWTKTNTYLTVERKEGAGKIPVAKPAEFLQELCGQGIGFDPLDFTGKKPADQVQMLLDVLSLPEDPRSLDATRKELYDQRTLVNRQVKQAEGAAAQSTHYPDAPRAEVSTADLLAEYQRRLGVIEQHNQQRTEWRGIQDAHARAAERVEQLKAALVDAEAELAECTMHLNESCALVGALVDPDLAAVSAQMREAETVNARVRANQTRERLVQAAAAYQTESDTLTAQIEALDRRKTALLTAAAFPLPGLAIAEDGKGGYVVTYQDVPLADCASSEQLRVSMALALALNPTIRVVLLREGSLLDEEALATVEEWAESNNVQVWVELATTREDGEGFTIEAGEVKEVRS